MNSFVTNPQITGVIKAALVSLGTTFLVQKGWISDEQLQQIIGAILVIVPVLWALWANRATGIVKSAENLPNVAQIVVTDTKTSDATGPKVVDVKQAVTAPIVVESTKTGEPVVVQREDPIRADVQIDDIGEARPPKGTGPYT